MAKICDACEFLKTSESKDQLLLSEYWRVGIGNNQAYLGRAYMTLRSHKGSLSELDDAEWRDFKIVVQKLETAYKNAFGASPLNWGCFMNHAFRAEPANPHVHWHIYPRYKIAPVFYGITFDDPLYGNFYDNNAERLVNAETVHAIAAKLSEHL